MCSRSTRRRTSTENETRATGCDRDTNHLKPAFWTDYLDGIRRSDTGGQSQKQATSITRREWSTQSTDAQLPSELELIGRQARETASEPATAMTPRTARSNARIGISDLERFRQTTHREEIGPPRSAHREHPRVVVSCPYEVPLVSWIREAGPSLK